ncbi:MAG TPA: pyruvate kinase [Eubacteriaceae bacterium]|nr:pyruvate kinase [Eubacteriaceae bacterium]
MKRTKIVCTIGPASESREVLKDLLKNGMNVARLNFSHGNYSEHKNKITLLREVSKELEIPVAILLDTKGPEIRIKEFSTGKALLEEGQRFIITTRDIKGNEDQVAVTYKSFPDELNPGDIILIDDGLIKLRVEKIDQEDITCIVENGGELTNNKSINCPNLNINLPAITKKDQEDIIFGIQEDIDFIAASFVRKPQDVLDIRKVLEENNGGHIHIISKIENQEGVNNIDKIIKVSDGIMIARGDLGVEIPPEEVPLIQKTIIRKCNESGKPVITATQMLDSMIRNPRPTRAEVTDVANAVFDGTDAIMLSGETASGKYPIQAVKTMVKIAKTTEESLEYKEIIQKFVERRISVTNAISQATCRTADVLGVSAIFTATSSGHTARMVSKFRPSAQIIAFTPNYKVANSLLLVWGVYPVLINEFKNTDEIFDITIKKALDKKLVNSGELVVITAGVPVGIEGTTNMIKVQTIGKVLLYGKGIGRESVTGKVSLIKDKSQFDKFRDGYILVAKNTDEDFIPLFERASGIIVEEKGLSSHTANIAARKGIPTVVAAENAMDILKDHQEITIETDRGIVYDGIVKVL